MEKGNRGCPSRNGATRQEDGASCQRLGLDRDGCHERVLRPATGGQDLSGSAD